MKDTVFRIKLSICP